MNVLEQKQEQNIPFQFSPKSLDFIGYPSKIDICEGTARSSKSTSMMFKLGLFVNGSTYNQFFIAGNTAGAARRNLINNQNGFLDMFRGNVRDGTNPKYGNHLIFTDTNNREKIIYIFGFRDKSRWEAVLGSTLAGGVIDEINTADTDFLSQVFRSLSSIDNYWLGATLNPDNPDKEIYTEFINKTRPLRRWVWDIPQAIIQELKTVKETLPKAIYWHFNFRDNPAMTEEKVNDYKRFYPPGSFYYNSLILGIRGVAEGVIFGKYLTNDFFSKNTEVVFDAKKQMIDEIEYKLKTNQYIRYTVGVDLGNNEIKKGTVLTFTGLERGFKGVAPIDVYEAEAKEANELVIEICDKIIEWYKKIPDPSRFAGVYIDGYGSIQVLIPTIRKRLYSLGYRFLVDLCIKFGDDGGRKARMMLTLLLINQKKIMFNSKSEGSKELFKNLKKIVYDEKDGMPLDTNQIEMDYYDSFCYSITPFTTKLNEDILGGNL